jgi:hypothetical protein
LRQFPLGAHRECMGQPHYRAQRAAILKNGAHTWHVSGTHIAPTLDRPVSSVQGMIRTMQLAFAAAAMRLAAAGPGRE